MSPSQRPPEESPLPGPIRHPLRTLLLGLVLTALVGTGAGRLELRTDGAVLVPVGSPEVSFDREMRATFDAEDVIAVVLEVEAGDSIYRADVLRALAELTEALRQAPGVEADEVTSLATERIRRALAANTRGPRNALDFASVLEPLPRIPEELDAVRRDVEAMGIFDGTLVSKDGRAAAILVGVPPGADREGIVEAVRAAVEAPGSGEAGSEVPGPWMPPDVTVHVAGAPVAETELGRHVLEDLSLLVPVAIGVMVLVFWARYRCFGAIWIPLLEVGACLVFVFGAMGWAGVPVSLTITILPVILTAVGVADEVHLFDRFARLWAEESAAGAPDDRRRLATQTLEEMTRPVVATSLTTTAAFLSFAAAPLEPVRHLGLFAALGVVFCLAWSLAVVPACLVLDRSRFRRGAAEGDAGERWRRFGRSAVARRRRVLAIAVVLALLAAWGTSRIRVQDGWTSGFAEGSPFRRAAEAIDQRFFGAHRLLLAFDSGGVEMVGDLQPLDPESTGEELWTLVVKADPEVDPAALVGEKVPVKAQRAGSSATASRLRRAGTDLVARVTAAERVGGEIRLELSMDRGFLSRLRQSLRYEVTGERFLDSGLLNEVGAVSEAVRAHLGEAGGVLGLDDQLVVTNAIVEGRLSEARDGERLDESPKRLQFLLSVLRLVRGEARVEELITADHRRVAASVFLGNANFTQVEALIEVLRREERERLAPRGVRLGLAGDVAVSQAMIGAVVHAQVRSLLLSLLAVGLVASVLLGSWRRGLLALLPSAAAVGVGFGVMGLVGVPLGVATSMFAAMTVGIGVDFAIHLVERWRRDRSLDRALRITGPAIVTNALVIGLGFGVMGISSVPANARLGLFVVVGVGTCLVSTLGLLPVLLAGPASDGEDCTEPGRLP